MLCIYKAGKWRLAIIRARLDRCKVSFEHSISISLCETYNWNSNTEKRKSDIVFQTKQLEERSLPNIIDRERRSKKNSISKERGRRENKMYTNPFNRKHSTIRQMLDRLLDPTKKSIRRSESVSSSGSGSSKGSNSSLSRCIHGHRVLQWGRKWNVEEGNRRIAISLSSLLSVFVSSSLPIFTEKCTDKGRKRSHYNLLWWCEPLRRDFAVNDNRWCMPQKIPLHEWKAGSLEGNAFWIDAREVMARLRGITKPYSSGIDVIMPWRKSIGVIYSDRWSKDVI